VGDKYLLQLVGDFADQKGVDLPAEYVNFGVNSPVVSMDSHGAISALIDGTGIISVARDGISALTQDIPVSIQQLSQNQLTVPLSDQFSFVGAFQLDVGTQDLNTPVQLALPAPVGSVIGQEVRIHRIQLPSN
jgi:hypothetical protein